MIPLSVALPWHCYLDGAGGLAGLNDAEGDDRRKQLLACPDAKVATTPPDSNAEGR